MNLMKKLIPICLIFILGCGSHAELSTVKELDLNKYKGTWYEIQRFPHRFEKNLQCVSATYSILKNGSIQVYNKGYNTEKERYDDIVGSAKVPDDNKPGEIKVTFFKPFYGNYYVIDLAKDYSTALVGDPSRDYLWILSRTKSIDANRLKELRNIAKENGFNIEKLEDVSHDCPPEILD